ncbi:MAG: hypothetical protein RLZ44_35 [Pseudomonadota bacterium]|jgi:limonene-1,2-epoxide hydrolase
MQRTEPLRLVERYLDALAARDFSAVRGCLADTGFRYVSPIAQFDDPDAFVASMEGVGAILHRIDIVHRFESDGVVCHVLDITVNLEARRMRRVVEVARVQGGRISDLEVIFDATEFHRMIITDDQS